MFATFIVITVVVQLPTTVLGDIGARSRQVWSTIYPQGWQFFTKDPDDEEATVYSLEGSSISSISRFPNSKGENLFGFVRAQRAQGTELASLVEQATRWLDCATVEDDCLIATAKTGSPQSAKNSSDTPTICGTVIVVMTVPVPWDFRAHFTGWRVDDRAALLEVECP